MWIILLGRRGGRKLDAKRSVVRRYVGGSVCLGDARGVVRIDACIGFWENALERLLIEVESEGAHGGGLKRAEALA